MEPVDQQGRVSHAPVCEDRPARQPAPLCGLPPPLFERLLAGDPGTSGPLGGGRILDRQGVMASVGRELERLFVTRLAPDAGQAVPGTGFGVRDWGAVNPASAAGLKALGGELAAKAAAYEPRLEQVRVDLWPDPANRRRACGALTALLRLNWTLEPVSFALAIEAAKYTVRPEGEEIAELPGESEVEPESAS